MCDLILLNRLGVVNWPTCTPRYESVALKSAPGLNFSNSWVICEFLCPSRNVDWPQIKTSLFSNGLRSGAYPTANFR